MRVNTIVIVGGGFAGTSLVRALEPRLPDGWELVLVSEESYTTFSPMLQFWAFGSTSTVSAPTIALVA